MLIRDDENDGKKTVQNHERIVFWYDFSVFILWTTIFYENISLPYVAGFLILLFLFPFVYRVRKDLKKA